MSRTSLPLHAFIDESGQRARTNGSSDHFVMTAVVIADEDLSKARALLAALRESLHRKPGDHLTWKNLKQHSQRLHVGQTLGAQPWLTISSVVVCKRHLSGDPLNDDQSYLYTLRYLLERLSWIAREYQRILHYTMAHIHRFKIAKLRSYEILLRNRSDCAIEWQFLDPAGGKIDQPQRFELLQLGDLATSAIGAAFNIDPYGNTEQRYLTELAPRLYRRGNGVGNLTSYGLKLHPWSDNTKATYRWVTAL